MKKIICLILALIMCTLVFASCNDGTSSDSNNNNDQQVVPEHKAPLYIEIDRTAIDTLEGVTESDTPTDYVLIDVKDYGKILIRLFPDVAPKTVENFKRLVSEKYYDGIIFHRVMKNFMIQGGDPDGNGISDPDEITVPGEFTSNGFKNNLKHTRGVVSLARTDDPDSGSSQFFICHKTSGVKHLDKKYASFGYVVYGMDVVDAIAEVDTNSNDKPLKNVVMTSIRFVTVPDQAPEADDDTNVGDGDENINDNVGDNVGDNTGENTGDTTVTQ